MDRRRVVLVLDDLREMCYAAAHLFPGRAVQVATPYNRLDRYTVSSTLVSDGEPFGPVRLREFAAAQGKSEPAAFANTLMDTVSIHEQEDDLTIVVAEAL